MANLKVTNANLATGYWGRDPATHIAALQTPQKIIALNGDKVKAMGLPFRLWTRLLASSEPRSLRCSCWNETAQQSDVTCSSCYGMQFQPGYLRFGFRTTFYSSIHTDLITTGLELNKTVQPFRLHLSAASLTGTLVTPLYAVSDTNLGTWEYKLDAFTRDAAHSTVVAEFTQDDTNWLPLDRLGAAVNPNAGQNIRFRVTLTRTALNIKSPLFEILRVRFPIVPSVRTREPLAAAPGDILILKTWDVERYKRESSGYQVDVEGERYWTMPLGFFDARLDWESPQSALTRDHFLEDVTGPQAGIRYVSTRHAFSRNFKAFTRQDFNLRRVIGDPNDRKSGENIMRVW